MIPHQKCSERINFSLVFRRAAIYIYAARFIIRAVPVVRSFKRGKNFTFSKIVVYRVHSKARRQSTTQPRTKTCTLSRQIASQPNFMNASKAAAFSKCTSAAQSVSQLAPAHRGSMWCAFCIFCRDGT